MVSSSCCASVPLIKGENNEKGIILRNSDMILFLDVMFCSKIREKG